VLGHSIAPHPIDGNSEATCEHGTKGSLKCRAVRTVLSGSLVSIASDGEAAIVMVGYVL
jgi:hypothetical protein